ncbi:hypothetical protein [Herbiconiux sp. A18JL235]|uniref:Protein kinase domain-containing protein n=1 Tax=Herbiconiux sp. A18JL235 TaxID=3152363 RepID=A0AB39BMD5_9MICO
MRSDPRPLVAGYRLLEVVSVGMRATVYLARREGREGRAEGEVVVLKVAMTRGRHARAADGAAAGPWAGAEVEVLRARPLERMPRLIEVVDGGARGAPPTAVVMTRCAGVPLEALLGRHGCGFDGVGESLRELVQTLHAAGFAHGGIDGSSVLLEGSGRVSLVGFGRSVASTYPRFERMRARDLDALTALAAAVGAPVARVVPLSGRAAAPRVGPGGGPATVATPGGAAPPATTPADDPSAEGARRGGGTWVEEARRCGGTWVEEVRRGGGTALEVSSDPGVGVGGAAFVEQARVGFTRAGAGEWVWEEAVVEEERREPSMAEAIDPAWEAVVALADVVRRAVRRKVRSSRRELVSTRRRKLLVGGVVGAVVVTAAVCGLLPGRSAGETAAVEGGATAHQSAAVGEPTVSGTATPESGAGANPVLDGMPASEPPATSLPSPPPAPLSPPTNSVPTASAPGGDPVKAAADEVASWGARLEGARVDEELGGAVIVAGQLVSTGAAGEETTKPVSLLVVRSETGWKVRPIDASRDDPG